MLSKLLSMIRMIVMMMALDGITMEITRMMIIMIIMMMADKIGQLLHSVNLTTTSNQMINIKKTLINKGKIQIKTMINKMIRLIFNKIKLAMHKIKLIIFRSRKFKRGILICRKI